LRFSRFLLAAGFVAAAATMAKADGIDPTVVIRRTDPPPVIITSPDQVFDITATSKNPIFAFQNETGTTLDALTLDLFGVNVVLDFSCGSFAGADIFENCSAAPGTHNDWIISFSGVGPGFSGITAATCEDDDKGKGDDKNETWGDTHNHDDKWECTGGLFSLEFGGIPKGAKVGGTGTFVTPEPVTAVLLLGGLAGLAGLRKRRNS
jgi:hypothetical protein